MTETVTLARVELAALLEDASEKGARKALALLARSANRPEFRATAYPGVSRIAA